MINKNLKSLLDYLPEKKVYGNPDVLISSIVDDSRKVKKGDLFVAIKGLTSNGHDYISKAIESGASAIVGEEDLQDLEIPYVKVPDSRKALSLLSSAWYDNPSKKMTMIGVTGTDGKTTTANLIYEILKGSGKKVGLISTVSAKIGSDELDTGFHVTNPEPIELHKFLNEMVEKDLEYAVIEVTSHGLDQERVAGIEFEVSVLTNITHEHLDYHKTFDNYLKAKAKLFLNSKTSVLNKDDNSFEKMKAILQSKTKIISYSKDDLDGDLKITVNERFPEEYNLSNATAAITVSKQLGINDNEMIQSIKSFPGIVGRMQEIKNDKGLKIIVDFAHTPNALESVLTALKSKLKNNSKLIAVFGCASERDNDKRPLMANVSTRLADISVFTAEDPRREDINKIFNEMVIGVELKSVEIRDLNVRIEGSKHYYIRIPERGEAIFSAINVFAKPGDIVIICGKGHEKSMSYDGIEYPWNDQEAVEMALEGKIKEIKR